MTRAYVAPRPTAYIKAWDGRYGFHAVIELARPYVPTFTVDRKMARAA